MEKAYKSVPPEVTGALRGVVNAADFALQESIVWNNRPDARNEDRVREMDDAYKGLGKAWDEYLTCIEKLRSSYVLDNALNQLLLVIFKG